MINEDFRKMRYNVHSLQAKDDILKKFVDLNLYSEFKTKFKISTALLFKWVNFMYDPKSPFVKIPQIRKRAFACAMEAGFPLKYKKFPKAYSDIINFDVSVRVPLGSFIIAFCKLVRSTEYAQLAVYEQTIDFNNTKLLDIELEPIDMSRIIEANNKLGAAIDTLKERFFSGDTSALLDEELVNYIDSDNLEFSPEKIVIVQEVRKAVLTNSVFGMWKYRAFSKDDLTDYEKVVLRKEMANETEESKSHFKALGIHG